MSTSLHTPAGGQISQSRGQTQAAAAPPAAAGNAQPGPQAADLQALRFAAVAEALAARAGSSAGKALCHDLPWLDAAGVAASLAQVDEARRVADAGMALPAGPPFDVTGHLAELARDATLPGAALVQLAGVMEACEGLRRFAAQEGGRFPALAELARPLAPLGRLRETLLAALAADGSLKDDASLALSEARARARSLDARIRGQMDRALQDPDVACHLQDDFVSLRNERYVLPVVASFQAKVPGIVHNASQTGQTLFVEPADIVPLGNALVVLRAQVREEEARLLQLLGREVHAQAVSVHQGIDVLARLDVVLAAATVAQAYGWHAPRLAPANGPLRLPALRHPELQLRGAQVVANDVALAGGGQALVVSGPNAGGKTVTLRAVGLCARMVRAGLPIPAGPGAIVPLFDDLVAEVGDAQDLARGHSSFSAHLVALKRALAAAGPGTLVLLDEVGKDTDPSEGAALAQAVLTTLVDAGAHVIATTHLAALKALAHTDGRFANARMALHPETLAPTYRLEVGAAGQAHAFAIAERVGLPEAVLARARRALHGDEGQLTQALASLEVAHRALAAERDALAEAHRTVAAERQALQQAGEAAAAAAEQARAEAERTLAQRLDAQAAALTRHLAALEAHAAGADGAARAQRADWHRQAARARTAAGPARAAAPGTNGDAAEGPALAAATTPLAVGRTVWVTTLARAGELVALADDHAVVALGAMRTRVPRHALKPLRRGSQRPTVPPAPKTQLVRAEPTGDEAGAAAPGGRCDVRGLRLEQAEALLVRALDACLSDGLGQLWVVHGHGTGALRQHVRAQLQRSPYVAHVRPGLTHEGGDGVTIASFDPPAPAPDGRG